MGGAFASLFYSVNQTKDGDVMKNIIYNWTFSVLGSVPIALGIYMITHVNYLDNRFPHGELFDWLDTPLAAVGFILLGVVTLFSIVRNIKRLRILMLSADAAMYALFGTAFFFRDLAGFSNLTWIFAFGSTLAIFGVAYREDGRPR